MMLSSALRSVHCHCHIRNSKLLFGAIGLWKIVEINEGEHRLTVSLTVSCDRQSASCAADRLRINFEGKEEGEGKGERREEKKEGCHKRTQKQANFPPKQGTTTTNSIFLERPSPNTSPYRTSPLIKTTIPYRII